MFCLLIVDWCLAVGVCSELGVFGSLLFVVLCRYVLLRVVGCGALFVGCCLFFVHRVLLCAVFVCCMFGVVVCRSSALYYCLCVVCRFMFVMLLVIWFVLFAVCYELSFVVACSMCISRCWLSFVSY